MAYYGEWIITNVVDTEEQGIPGKLLSFAPENDSKGEEHPLKDMFGPDINYDNLITELPCDWETHGDKKLLPIENEIIEILKKYNVTVGVGDGVRNDMQYLFEHIYQKLTYDRQVVLDTYWGVSPHFQTILQLDRLMKDLAPKEA